MPDCSSVRPQKKSAFRRRAGPDALDLETLDMLEACRPVCLTMER